MASTVVVNFVGDTRKLDRALGRSQSRLGAFAKNAARIGGAVAAAGAGAAIAFGVKAVSAASDLNETLAKTEQVFGRATDKVTGFADRMAEAFGLPKAQLLDAASNIGLVAKASGLGEGAAADMSTQMAQLAADASSFFNVPLDVALEKIRSGLVGEAEPLRQFGVLLSAAAVKEKAVAEGIASAGEELTEQQKVLARAAIITEQMGDASGDLERTQDSMANKVRKLQGRFENFTAELGMKLLPVAEDLLEWADDNLPGAFATVERVVTGAQSVFSGIGNTISTVVGFFRSGSSDMEGSASRIGNTLSTLGDTFSSIFEAIQEVVETVISVVSEAWERFGEGLLDNISRQLDNVLRVIGGVLKAIGGVFEVFIGVFTGDWSRAWEGVKQIFAGIWDALEGIVRTVLESIRIAIETIGGVISLAWSRVWGGIKSAFSSVWDDIKGVAVGAINFIIDRINDLIDAANSVGDALDKLTPGDTFGEIPTIPHVGGGGSPLERRPGQGIQGVFDDGGVVPGRGPKLIVAHGGETILPTHKQAAEVNVNVSGMDLEPIAEMVTQKVMFRLAQRVP